MCPFLLGVITLWLNHQFSWPFDLTPACKPKTADTRALCAFQAVNLVMSCALNLKINPARTFYPFAAAYLAKTTKQLIRFRWRVVSLSDLLMELCREICNLSVKNAISEGEKKCEWGALKEMKRESLGIKENIVWSHARPPSGAAWDREGR